MSKSNPPKMQVPMRFYGPAFGVFIPPVQKCDVCREREQIHVFASSLTAMSFGYCDECAKAKVEPVGAICQTLCDVIESADEFNDDNQNINPWLMSLAKRTMSHLDISEADFKVGLQQCLDDYYAYCSITTFDEGESESSNAEPITSIEQIIDRGAPF